jgi:hypothetical protein
VRVNPLFGQNLSDLKPKPLTCGNGHEILVSVFV